MKQLLKSKTGATAMEYALIAALISVVIVLALTAIGTSLNNTYSSIGSSLEQAQ